MKSAEVVGSAARASLGVAAGSPDDNALDIVHAVDVAMYRAKRDGETGSLWQLRRAGKLATSGGSAARSLSSLGFLLR
ncbi:MAG: hypothetical protein ABSE47_06255 [Acidimicrobiales bacterium]